MIHATVQSAMAQGFIRGLACAVFLAVLAITVGWLVEKWRDRGQEPPAHPVGIVVAIVGVLLCALLIVRTTLTSFGVWS